MECLGQLSLLQIETVKHLCPQLHRRRYVQQIRRPSAELSSGPEGQLARAVESMLRQCDELENVALEVAFERN